MFNENADGYLQNIMEGKFTRRQDCPQVWEYNGAVYVMNVNSLKEKSLAQFTKRKKYVMSAKDSIDLDTPDDWDYAEFIMRSKGSKN